MKEILVTVLAITTLTVTAVAQDFQGQPREGRGGGRRGGEGPGHGPPIGRLIERLSEQINLDAEQIVRIEEIVAAHEEQMQEFRARRQEMRAAMEAGDEERVAELREQFRQQRDERRRAFEGVFDEIEPVLREDQIGAYRQFREDLVQRRDSNGPGRMRDMMRDLPDAVNMTEDQRKQFGELLDKRREMMREQMRERWRQGEGAGFDGAAHPDRPDFAAMQDEFFNDVSGILNDDQLDLLAEYWAPFESGTRTRGQQDVEDFRVILQAAKRVRNLTGEQKQTWREITREAMRSYRDLRRAEKEQKAQHAGDVKAKVLKLLNEEQTKEFERNLERLKSVQTRARQRRWQSQETPRTRTEPGAATADQEDS